MKLSATTKLKLAIWGATTTAWALLSSAFSRDGFEATDFLEQTRDAAVLVGLGMMALELGHKAYCAYTPNRDAEPTTGITNKPVTISDSSIVNQPADLTGESDSVTAKKPTSLDDSSHEEEQCTMYGRRVNGAFKLSYYG